MKETEILKQILNDPKHLAAFLHGLAEVETAGATWILATPPESWSMDFREHALDELRHAKKLRELARKFRVVGEASEQTEREENYSLAANHYLQRLFSSCYRLVRKSATTALPEYYLYAGLALAVERRLMKIYPILAKHAKQEDVRVAAAQLIAEEKGHLGLVTRTIQEKGLEQFADLAVSIEEKLASEWFGQISKEIDHESNYCIALSGA